MGSRATFKIDPWMMRPTQVRLPREVQGGRADRYASKRVSAFGAGLSVLELINQWSTTKQRRSRPAEPVQASSTIHAL